eukprot:TRINITY_DN5896_c0_g1_i1.p1 TRINITY_DN5896_c0_g1~~TRINITY_DN5896_c0_g1_i1.p1  ORF type:complete len:389 (+),score=60.61 TRINITY_DN5896_c0_g1_i1:68-1234(+)
MCIRDRYMGMSVLKQLSNDEQDSVRVIALDSLTQIAKILNKDENKTQTLPIIIAATEDKSWRVRLALAKNFAGIAEAFGKEITDLSLIQIFTTILRDVENDVKAAAVESLSNFINMISPDKLSILLPSIQALSKDSFLQVRSSVGHVMASLISISNKDVITKLIPNLFDLLDDEDPNVKVSGLKASAKFAQVASPDFVSNLLPHIRTAFSSSKWRVRLAGVEALVDIACAYGDINLFEKTLEPLYFQYLTDKAHAVRELGVQSVPKLIKAFNKTWLNGNLLPRLNDIIAKDFTYLLKITALYSLEAATSVLKSDEINDKILPMLIRCGRDSVPNVRFTVINILKNISNKLDDPALHSVKSLYTELSTDKDKDVQFFAQDALANLQSGK